MEFEDASRFVQCEQRQTPPIRVLTPDIENKVPVYGGNGVSWYTNKTLFKPPFLITGRVGTLGTVFRVYDHVWVSDNALCLHPLKPENLEFAYFTMSDLNFNSLNSGSTQPLITQTAIKNQAVVHPGNVVLRVFSSIVHSLFERIEANIQESRILARTRDLLLPKLMSGELRVRDAEALVAEAL